MAAALPLLLASVHATVSPPSPKLGSVVLGRIKVPVRLVRFHAFDGANISFADNSSPTTPEALPLASACHELAAKLQPYQLCKATIHNGTVLMLEPTKVLLPATS